MRIRHDHLSSRALRSKVGAGAFAGCALVWSAQRTLERLLRLGELANQIPPLRARHGGGLAALGTEIQKADHGIPRLEAEAALHPGIVCRLAGLPHRVEAERI